MEWKTDSNVCLEEKTVDRIVEPNEEIFKNEEFLIQTISNATLYIMINFPNVSNLGMDDLDARKMQILAETGGAFDFLNDPEEKTYSKSEGEPL